MKSQHDEQLQFAFDSWGATKPVSPTLRNRYWRGTGALDDTTFPGNTGPGCVVPIEYARLALLENDQERQGKLLQSVSNFQTITKSKLTYATASRHMALALSALAAAGVYYRKQEFEDFGNQIKIAAEVYDKLWRISKQAVGQSTASTAPAITGNTFTPSHFGNSAGQAMEAAQQYGVLGSQGCSVSTWLTFFFAMHYLLETEDLFAQEPGYTLKMLLADTINNSGHVAPVHFQSVDLLIATPAHSGIFLDCRAWGITIPPFVQKTKANKTIQVPAQSMRESLWLAWRCCRQSLKFSTEQSSVIRIGVDLPDQCYELSGASAGGLFAIGMYAAAQRNRKPLLDASCTTTCRLAISPEALENHLERLQDETQPLYPHEISLESVGSVPSKLDEAWKRQHQLDTFLLNPSDAALWEAKRGSGQYPQIRHVSNLAQLWHGFLAKDHEEHALENLASYVHGAWGRAVAAVESEDPHNREREHRLDCYVSPSFRVERYVPSTAENLPAGAGLPTNDVDTLKLEMEVTVPSSSDDDDLLHLLALSIRGQSWPGQPNWVKPNRHLVIYDNAGAGKSVCSLRLRYLLTQQELTDRQRIFGHPYPPLVVNLEGYWPREHLDGGRLLDLREAVESYYATTMLRTNPADRNYVKGVVDHAIKNKRVVFIADGLDQFGDDDRKHLAKVFNDDRDAMNCHWIILGRVHAIEESKEDRLFDDRWLRVRIDPFTPKQQDAYFDKPVSRPIGSRWTTMIDREAMGELLKLPVVLSMLRTLIESAPPDRTLPVFESLSQLYLVTSRQMLVLALQKNLTSVRSKLTTEQWQAFENIALIPAEKQAKQLELLEHVLSLFAFQLMLLGNRNARVLGPDNVAQLHQDCENRYFHECDQQDLSQLSLRERIKQEQAIVGHQNLWEIAVKVLHTIEFSHRGLTEAMNQSVLALRSRKVMECMAARYLTRYASEHDVFGDQPDTCWNLEANDSDIGLKLAAVDFGTDPEWKEVWLLAINMPQQPLRVTGDIVYQDAVISPQVTTRSLSVLFRQPKPYPGREVRPTELIYRAWHLFEYDEQLLRERRFLRDGNWIRGEQLAQQDGIEELQRLGNSLLLGKPQKRNGASHPVLIEANMSKNQAARAAPLRVQPGSGPRLTVSEQRLRIIAEFRDQRSQALVRQFTCRLDTILVDEDTDQRESISADDEVRKTQLAAWAQQTSYEKSHTFLQCPPQAWLKAYQTGNLSQDPRINPAIEGHETFAFAPILMQATTVTRWQYRQFDPAFETWDEVSDRINQHASAFGAHSKDDDFPIICTDWRDAWVFAKWLGPDFGLPNEWAWEHAARAGTTTDYHFGEGCNGSQANCDGNHPYGKGPRAEKLAAPPFLQRTTPVGCADYPCSPWGLWDMHGNVWEWCENFLGKGGSDRVVRGGSWEHTAVFCRSRSRYWFSHGRRDRFLGIRVALVLSGRSNEQSPGT